MSVRFTCSILKIMGHQLYTKALYNLLSVCMQLAFFEVFATNTMVGTRCPVFPVDRSHPACTPGLVRESKPEEAHARLEVALKNGISAA